MVYSEGEWKQKVGNELTKVGKNVQHEAQKTFEEKSLPEITVSKEDVKLVKDVQEALSKTTKFATDTEIAKLNKKYGKESVDKAIEVEKKFDKIKNNMQDDDLLSQECKT